MLQHEIVTQLSTRMPANNPVYEITTQTILTAIVQRIGEEALTPCPRMIYNLP